MIGRRTSYLDSPEEAADAIAGWLVVNDVSERAFQMERGGQWVKGKSAETFNPAGPWLVTPDEIDDVRDLDLWLDVNGVRRQTGNTATMVFDPYFLVHYVSQFLVLEPGDLINTGTPPGVGMGFDPPIWLQPGDVMELGIEGLGAQRQQRARSAVTDAMRAFVLTGPGEYAVQEVPRPGRRPRRGVVDVERVGVCGTDVEFFTGEMAYLHQGHARYPMRLGHEWCGTVTAVGDGVDPALGRPAGDGRHDAGRRHLPPLPAGPPARVREPAGGRDPRRPARRPRRAAGRAGLVAAPRCRTPSTRCSAPSSSRAATPCARPRPPTCSPGTGYSSSARGPSACWSRCSSGRPAPRSTCSAAPRSSLAFAAGARASTDAWTADTLPDLPFDAVIDASNARAPARAGRWSWSSPAGRVVYIGLAGTPEPASTPGSSRSRTSPPSASCPRSPGLDATIEAYADGRGRPPSSGRRDGRPRRGRPRCSPGERPAGAGPGPKIHVDPRLLQ